MRQASGLIGIQTRRRGLVEITAEVARWTRAQGIGEGLLTLFLRHTSASLVIAENASPDVRADLQAFFDRLAPEAPGRYAHADEGPDDMPAHIRSLIGGVSLAIPVRDGVPALGTWQGVFIFEHRRAPHRREVATNLIGE